MPDTLSHFALTPAQEPIWAGQRMAPDRPMYNMAWRFTIGGPVNPGLFERAFANVVSRTDALRIVFEDTEHGPRQRVLEGPAGTFETLEFGTAHEADRWIRDAVERPFDLASGTFRGALLKITGDEWIWFHNQHHIVHDATSGALLLEAVSAAYGALVSGEAPSDVPLPRFIAPQDQGAGTRDTETVRAATVHAPVPKLYRRSASATSTSAQMVRVSLGKERGRRFGELARHEDFAGLSPRQTRSNIYMTVLAAWLRRVSGQAVFPAGLVLHGRSTLVSRETIGCFVELFPLKLGCEPGASFADLYAGVSDAAFDVLRQAASGSRTRAPFNVVLNTIPSTFAEFAGLPLDVEWVDCGHTDPSHAMRVNVMEFGDEESTELGFLFNDSVFDADLRERAVRHFLRLLDAFLDDPEQVIDAVPLSGETDASAALAGTAPSEAPSVDNVLDAFRRQLAREPGATAIVDDAGAASREWLDARSGAVAEALAGAGIGPGARVGVHLTRSRDLVAAILGVLRLGAAFVPLDPAQPFERLAAISESAGFGAILTERRLTARWPETERTIDIDGLPERPSATVPHAPADGTAYIIFTSGSTGRPKGVVVGHPALTRYAHWAARAFEGEGACWALHSSIGFDLTITSIFAPLVTGGTIRAYRNPAEGADLSILDVFSDDAVDVVKLTPAHLAVALVDGKPIRRIRSLVLGGEDLPTALCRRTLHTLGHHVAIFNEYGPTEAVVGCMLHRFDETLDTEASVPIGRAAEATRILVLDRGMHPAADETIGEIYIGGPDRLAEGYLGLPDETAERFVSDPYVPGGTLYRSGDLGSVRRDGTILYHGRSDTQLKIGGVRIEPAEITAAAQGHPQVSACFVGEIRVGGPPSKRCRTCGIGDTFPEARIGDDGQCETCRKFAALRDRANGYFLEMDDLRAVIDRAHSRTSGEYDCVMLLSGGKDSTYALCRLAEITPRILTATLDNGFISEEAKDNIRRVTEALGLDHRFLTTPAMNEIFVDSLRQHANVCNGCFKTIYTLGYRLARDVGAPLIVTGLSRGQLFETRLAPELFDKDRTDPSEIDRLVMEARRSYHRHPDVAARRLNQGLFDDDRIFEQVEIVDFYRYCDVPVAKIYDYLTNRIPWSRPKDTGRSTNCLINDVGIRVHRAKRGYHNYALPYSWDVRLGHKTVEEAQAELDDEIDEARVRAILNEIGYDEPLEELRAETQLVCYYVSGGSVTPRELRDHLRARLPREMIPAHILEVPRIPITANGKVDRSALPDPRLSTSESSAPRGMVEPGTPAEARLLEIWRRVLRTERIGVEDNFYEIGGDSIAAIRIATEATSLGLSVGAIDVLRAQTVAGLAKGLTEEPKPAAPRRGRANLDPKSAARLGELFGGSKRG